jgi:prophage DNA circulation protein
MSWLTQLKDASYKGVPFKVDIADLQFGRDIEVSQTPTGQLISKETGEPIGGGLNPWVRDRGLLQKQFTVTAHFAGLNYLTERDAFIGAIENGGGGELQLPTFDPINVIAGKAAIQFNNKQGGFESIKVVFHRYELKVQPETSINTQKAATEGIDASKETFLASFGTKLESGAQWVAEASTNLTTNISTTINDTLGLGAVGDGLEAVTEASNTLAQNATTLIYTPTVLADQINDAVSALTFAFEQPINAFNAQLQMLENYGVVNNSAGSTPTEQDAIDNNNSFVMIVNNTALAEAGRAAVLEEYTTLDDAQRAKSRFEAAARAQQLLNGNTPGYEESYREISDIMALVSSHITAQGELPSNVDISYPDTNVSVVLAHDLYGDAERGAEIVNRNSVRNPLFLPTELTVLSF